MFSPRRRLEATTVRALLLLGAADLIAGCELIGGIEERALQTTTAGGTTSGVGGSTTGAGTTSGTGGTSTGGGTSSGTGGASPSCGTGGAGGDSCTLDEGAEYARRWPGNCHCYRAVDHGARWVDAQAICGLDGVGHLVTITSDAELAFVRKLLTDGDLNTEPRNLYWLWIGLQSPTGDKHGPWVWSTGEGGADPQWADMEPNWSPGGGGSGGGSGGAPPLCAFVHDNHDGLWPWHDDPCDDYRGYVCETP
ncbi:MAG: C-type lectin domain-containing protein [Deltaproteobacteria bacterium]|jgi:hypothetical protein|nr:C-type lectin domain-containing protein [Deltaproteobacteria bacterium]MBW2532988.1 C-type lectin domain-containing protein [Deltaproteobacteria bacterium]